MAKLLLFVVLSVIFAIGYTKHVHPSNIMKQEEEDLGFESVNEKPIATDIDGIPLEVISHIRPSRFVPVNNVLFFMRYPPCEDGFMRDVLGVCREVWD